MHVVTRLLDKDFSVKLQFKSVSACNFLGGMPPDPPSNSKYAGCAAYHLGNMQCLKSIQYSCKMFNMF